MRCNVSEPVEVTLQYVILRGSPRRILCHFSLFVILEPQATGSVRDLAKDFCLHFVNNLYCGGIHPVFNEKSEKK
jgi:hypothetical protein